MHSQAASEEAAKAEGHPTTTTTNITLTEKSELYVDNALTSILQVQLAQFLQVN